MTHRVVGAAVAILLAGAMSLGGGVGVATGAATDGGLVVSTVDPAGGAVTAACLELWTDAGAGARGSLVAGTHRCDAPAGLTGRLSGGDGLRDGSLGWTGLAPGGYVVVETLPPALAGSAATYELAADRPVTVGAGGVARLTLVHRPTAGLTLHKVDPAGRPLAGSCFSLVAKDARSADRVIAAACDGTVPAAAGGPAGDGLADGLLLFTALAPTGGPTTYTLREVHPPDGYQAVADQTVTVSRSEPVELTITDTTGAATDGGLVVSTVDPAGGAVTAACLELWTDAGAGARGSLVAGTHRCDAPAGLTGRLSGGDGLRDGSLGWTGLAPGGYVVVETLPPALAGSAATYELAADRPVTVGAGGVARLTLVHRPTAGLTLHKVDPAGRPLAGSCFSLVAKDARSADRVIAAACDGTVPAAAGGPAGDGLADGLLLFTALAPTGGPTTYTLREVHPPDGYQAVADQTVTVSRSEPVELTITDTTGAATDGGLVVSTVDPAGGAVTAACLELWTDAGAGARGSLVAGTHRCDAPAGLTGRLSGGDGLRDGSLGWTGLAPGGYVVVETLPPALAGSAATYELAADRPVTVGAGGVARLTLVHRPTAGLTLHKVDPAGRPLAGSCFSLVAKDARSADRVIAAACDGTVPAAAGGPAGDGLADGLLLFTALAPTGGPTTYTLREVHPPDGYQAVADQTVTVSRSEPVELTITDTTGAATDGVATGAATLELEIDSEISITKLGGMPVAGGVTTAKGRISLQPDAPDAWHGSGTLDSVTTSGKSTTCPGIQVAGSGPYDWVVRSVHAGPDISVDAITVDMDSGPINETPDSAKADMCSLTTDSQLNTWENLFFDAYRSRYAGLGLHVDGWRAVGGPDVWTAGGEVAEATWTGRCVSTFVIECADHTTFRLFGHAGVAAPSPGTGGGATASESVTPSSLAAAVTTPVATLPGAGGQSACADPGGCPGLPVGPAIAVGALVAAGIGGLLLLRFLGSRGSAPLPVQPPQLNGSAGPDPAMETLAPDASVVVKLPVGFDKTPPGASTADTMPNDFIKLPIPPDASAPTVDTGSVPGSTLFDKTPPGP